MQILKEIKFRSTRFSLLYIKNNVKWWHFMLLIFLTVNAEESGETSSSTSSSESPTPPIQSSDGKPSGLKAPSDYFKRSELALDMEYFMPFPYSIKTHFNFSRMKDTDDDGCLKWNKGNFSIDQLTTNNDTLFIGLAKEGEKCSTLAFEEENTKDRCELYVNKTVATDDSKYCYQLTNLVCKTDGKSNEGTCQNGITTQEQVHQKWIAELDPITRCFVDKPNYNMSLYNCSDPDNQFNEECGLRKYREPCDPFAVGHNPSLKCEIFALDLLDHDNLKDSKKCFKYSHLYCDPILQLCLCGKGKDEMRFQYDGSHNLCYVRPTSNIIKSYECAPETTPRNMTVGSSAFEFCKCNHSDPTFFNTDNPSWWTCAASLKKFSCILQLILLSIILL